MSESLPVNVLVVGSLGPNQDRILGLASCVNRLVYAYSEFHPNLVYLESKVDCIPLARRNLIPQIRYLIARYNIGVIYSLMNAPDGSTEVTLELLDNGIEIPIVRHYKEHPCAPTVEERRVLLETDAQIYINQESFEYFREVYGVHSWSAHIMDADMIAVRYMADDFKPKLRLKDGEPHLLVAGGLSMLNDRLDVRDLCVEMNRRRVHVHLYGYMVGEGLNANLIVPHLPTRQAYERLEAALQYVHLHDYIGPSQFSSTWSCYDVGFMHSRSKGRPNEERFEQMNLPYRYTAYLAAGLPLAVSTHGQEAMKNLAGQNNIGLFFADYDELAERLWDQSLVASLASEAHRKRKSFSFDSYAEELAGILKKYSRGSG